MNAVRCPQGRDPTADRVFWIRRRCTLIESVYRGTKVRVAWKNEAHPDSRIKGYSLTPGTEPLAEHTGARAKVPRKATGHGYGIGDSRAVEFTECRYRGG